MAIMKAIEILADSDKSWEDAAGKAVKQAAKSVDNIRSVWIKDQSCVVKDDRITAFRVTTKITFEVKS